MGKAEKPGEREPMMCKMKQRWYLGMYVSAHMYVSPSIGMEYAYVKCVDVGRNEDKLHCVHALSRHTGMYPVIMCQDQLDVWPAEGCGGATQVLGEAEGGGVRGADRSLSLPLCSLEGNKD